MIDAVFISDLHLHPDDQNITDRFDSFINWAAIHTKSVYILGDFFHVWPGDDALDAWSTKIALQLAGLAEKGILLYFMPGNRDFLLGKQFAELARLKMIDDSTVITLDDKKILLVHGDRYCTKDKSHQWLRRFTRNTIFISLFLLLPYKFRARLVNNIRNRSEANHSKPMSSFKITTSVMLKHMRKENVNTLIHGHIHQPGINNHHYFGQSYHQYVLSDWDDNPLVLCYDSSNGFKFSLIAEL